MSKDFKITEEEINQVILRSPYSLADSPASLGQGASQIKCYFYAFIFELARKINTHLGQIMDAFSSQELVNSSLKEMDRELGSSIATGINSHNLSGQAHSDIREKASSDLINSLSSLEIFTLLWFVSCKNTFSFEEGVYYNMTKNKVIGNLLKKLASF